MSYLIQGKRQYPNSSCLVSYAINSLEQHHESQKMLSFRAVCVFSSSFLAADMVAATADGKTEKSGFLAKTAGDPAIGEKGSEEEPSTPSFAGYKFPVLEVTEDVRELAQKLVEGGPMRGGKGLVGLKGQGLTERFRFLLPVPTNTLHWTEQHRDVLPGGETAMSVAAVVDQVPGVVEPPKGAIHGTWQSVPFRLGMSFIQHEVGILMNYAKFLQTVNPKWDPSGDWAFVVLPGEQAEGQKFPDNKWSIDVPWFPFVGNDQINAETKQIELIRTKQRLLKKGLRDGVPLDASAEACHVFGKLQQRVDEYEEHVRTHLGPTSSVFFDLKTNDEWGLFYYLMPQYLRNMNNFAKAVLGALQAEVEKIIGEMKARIEQLGAMKDIDLLNVLLQQEGMHDQSRAEAAWRRFVVTYMADVNDSLGLRPSENGALMTVDRRSLLKRVREGIRIQREKLDDLILMNFIEDTKQGYSRNLWYPGVDDTLAKLDQSDVWAGSHTDICALTLIPAATDEGLELFVGDGQILERPAEDSAEWHAIAPGEIDMYLFLSDFLQANTQFETIELDEKGALKSTALLKSMWHRVRRTPAQAEKGHGRVSTPVFYNVKDDRRVSNAFPVADWFFRARMHNTAGKSSGSSFDVGPEMSAMSNLYVVVEEQRRILNANPATRANGMSAEGRKRSLEKVQLWSGEIPPSNTEAGKEWQHQMQERYQADKKRYEAEAEARHLIGAAKRQRVA
ncbi:unnamed protein product [Amoebophrya sp. A25]|nr:unnamed protein product [Amoebophrya sp. A25]|eukprot:GSA25T00015273001.1